MTCGISPGHRPGEPCSLPAGHVGCHSWDQRAVPKWTAEQIIERLQAWAAMNDGYGPREDDWHPGKKSVDPRWRTGEWPTNLPVRKQFGSFPAALEAAGLEPRPSRVFAPVPSRICPGCGREFRRAVGKESLPEFERRKTCSRECGSRVSTTVVQAREREAVVERMALAGAGAREMAAKLATTPNAIINLASRMRRAGRPIPRLPYGR